MFLEYGNESIHFKHKPIEGSPASPGKEPDELILDGQQRLTSLCNALTAEILFTRGRTREKVSNAYTIWILQRLLIRKQTMRRL